MLYSVGIIFLVIGLIFKAFPPKKINFIYGYRTNFSMKNQDIWKEAQKYSANSFIVLGFIYVVLGFVFSQFLNNISEGYQIIIFLTGAVIMLIVDEVHLRKVFNKDGSKKCKE